MDVATGAASRRAPGWVEVARRVGRHRKASAAVASGLLAAGLWAWWATQLWGLPDVGDPFDVAAFEAYRVPDDRNAFLWYRDAASKTGALLRARRAQKKDAPRKFEGDWAKASPAWREVLAESGEALATWRAGSEKPDALYEHPEGLSLSTLLPITSELGTLGRLGVLEGSRLRAEGDIAGAWGWYRAALRSSRHTGKHGFMVERLVGVGMHGVASEAIARWASDPRVDAPMLRRALDEVVAIDATTVPHSEPLKMHYLVFVHSLDDPNLLADQLQFRDPDEPPDWCQDLPISDGFKRPIQAARVFAADDRARSLRVARLMTANWLAQVDKPARLRSRLARDRPMIFEADPAAPPASRALPPAALSRWLESSLMASREYFFLGRYAASIDIERSRQAKLVEHMADQLRRRERGEPPLSPPDGPGSPR